MVFLYISKAFDTLDHTIGLHKLDNFDIRGLPKTNLKVISPTENNWFKLIIYDQIQLQTILQFHKDIYLVLLSTHSHDPC